MKREILLYILELTQLQREALKEGNIEKWRELSDERQQKMDQLDELHREKPEFVFQREEELLREIMRVDHKNTEEFQRQFEEVKRSLRKIRSQKQVGNVYSNPYDISHEEGIFFDKR